MGKKFLTSILLSLISTFLFTEVRVNSSTASALDVSLTIPELQFVEAKSTDGNMYSKLIVPQAGQLEVGKPDVPGFARWILIPNGTSVDISTYPGESVVYENVELAPVQPSPIDRIDAPLPPFTKDDLVFSTNADYPGVFAEAEPTKNKRGQSLTILWIYPYQYNPVRKTLTVYPDLEVSVSFSGMIQPIPFNLKNDNLETYLRSIAINAEEVLQAEENAESYLPEDDTRTDGCELLIITDPDNLDAANTLANWRIKRGIYTTVVTTTTTGTTTNQIESYIDNTVTWTPTPSYLLFIGDAEDIPPQYVGGTPSDFYYADLADPPDYVADFGYGRLSVDTASQADSLVARIIRYEKSPSTNSSYYTDILNAACFQDGELPSEMPDQIANRRFCKTSEDVRNYLHDIQSYPWSQREYVAYNRVGTAEIFPRWWNDTSQTFTYIFENDNPPNGGVEIPASMQKPTFPWDGNTADISSAFNNGVFFALFRAHGSISGWGDPDFYSWNVDALNNGEDRPIVWSITCQSGHFDNNECFAEHWIRHSTGGSCGVLAATRDSYSGKNDRLIWGMMNAIWPTFDSYCLFSYGGSTPIYRMGDVKNYGMDYMSTHYSVEDREETIRLFHWFGDPTMEMWTSQPSQLTSAQVTSNINIGTSSITVQINPAMSGFLVSICSENADEIFGTATTNASGIATVPLNNTIAMPGELYVTITKHNYKPYEFITGWGTWTGAFNYYWHNANNWSLGHIPLSNENVIITSDGYHPPKVDIYDEQCLSVTINPGASLDIKDQKLTVENDMTIHGELIMSDTAAELYIGDDIVWESGSSASITGSNAKISVQGDWNFESGANVQLNMGFVDFHGTGNTWIRSYDEDCNFNHIRNWKSGSYSMNISELSTADLYINGNIYNYSDSKIKFRSDHSVYLDGFFNNMNGYFEGQFGTFVYTGNPSVVSLKPTTGSYFNNLIIDSDTSALSLGADYSSTLTINGDFALESGYFYPGSFTVEIGGNWTNNAGIDHFGEASSRVIFNGAGHQYVNSDETFNILEVDCGAALRVDNVNHTVTCNSYDWTSGGIDVISGTFTALELEDNGLYGGYWLNPGGEINLHQGTTLGEYIDLNCYLWISGGTMNVYGGYSAYSYWPFYDDAEIDISGGVLDFHDKGIYLWDSTYSITEDITGGTIRTSRSFIGNRSDFTPIGGTIELYGSTDANLSMGAGSNFYNVNINKASTALDNKIVNKEQEYEIIRNRDGTETRIERSNTITADDELDINGDFIIEAGVFNPDNNTMYVAGDWTNNVGDAAFVEGTGLVVFDGASTADILTDETFYVLELDKTTAAFDALETGSGNGVDVTILQDLILTDGSFELNDPTHLSIGNSVFIHNGTILNANDSGTIHISVVEDWFDMNTSGGFDAGINSVVTFNGTTPGTLHSVRENDYFNDIVINSNSSYLRPSSPGGTTIYCKNMDIQAGKLRLSGYKVVVDNTLNISDRVEMANVNDSLLVGNIIWQAGSNDLITEGAILVNGNWTFADGTTAMLGANNTVYFDGATNQFIYCMDADAEFNDVVIDKSGGAAWIHSTTTDTMRVVGDMTVTSGSIFHVQYADLLIDGTLDVVNTGTMYLAHNGGTLTNNTDFTLNGEFNIDGGHALIHGQFELAASGILTIDEGSFVSDAPYTTERAIQSLYGTMNMTNGLFEITNNHISVKNSFVDNISGGRIRCGGSFTANSANTFQPTGGVVELTSNSTGYYLQCTNGNHLYDLEINALQSVMLHDDTTIYNDLEISAGSLISNNKNLHVGGNWTNNVGDAGFVESAGEVIFYGSNESDITTDEKFFNLTLDKTNPQFYALEIMDGLLIDVLNDLTILDGTLKMNTGSTLNIGNDLTIALDAGLNAFGNTGLTISVGGNWTNDNTIYSSFVGFNPGTSTVYFDGSNDQYLNTASPAEEFYHLVIDKSAGEFKPVNGTEIFSDLDILGGTWDDDIGGLTHNLYGDVYVAATGDWYGSGSIVAFKGDADQTFEFLPNSYLSDVIIDKSPVIRRTYAAPEEGQSEHDIRDESRGQTVILNSNLLTQSISGAMLIEEGTLNLNGHAAGNNGDIIINDGGKILVDEDAELRVGDGETLSVNSGGILEMLGLPGHEAIVTRFSIYDHYDFNVESGGTISADYCIFEYMTANGVNIQDNGIIDASHSFNNCTFRNGSSPGVLLTINNDQIVTINNAVFPENTWGSSFNVQKTLDHGHVEFVDAAGGFAGDDFDNDPFNRIDWTTSGQPDLFITNAVWSNTNPLVCNEITVDVTVKNMGNADVADNFYLDLYYNLSTPPVTFQLGDQFQQITTGLPAGDSLIVHFAMICTETQGIWHSYLQVDSDSQIAENDETNNVWGPDTITWQALPVVDDLVIVYNSGTGDIELSWTYAAEADDFNVYRDTDPNFIPAPGNKIGTTSSPNYSEPVSEDKFFYKVTAEKSCTLSENITGKRVLRGHKNKINN